jgi:cytidylate kinase
MSVIAVSRQVGTGAEGIARKAADSLRYDYVEKELISMVAREAKADEETILRFDERGAHPIVHFLKHFVLGDHRIVPAWPTYYRKCELETMSVRMGKASVSALSCPKFFEHVIKNLWLRGNVVIVGRGATAILSGCCAVLSVRFVAPLQNRLERVMLERGLNHDDALKTIKRTDRQRAWYMKQNYGINEDRPHQYDLLFDMARTTEEEVIETLCQEARSSTDKEIPSV